MIQHESGVAQSGACEQVEKCTIEPYLIAVPEPIAKRIDRAIELLSKRLGEEVGVRRMVEITALQRGLDDLLSEEGLR